MKNALAGVKSEKDCKARQCSKEHDVLGQDLRTEHNESDVEI